MMIQQFIDRLQQRGLLDKEVIEDLRRKVARAKGKKVTPEGIAKYLVDKGHLTQFQATKLVNDATSWPDVKAASDTPPRQSDSNSFKLLPADDDLMAVREPGARSKDLPPTKPVAPADEELDALTALDDDLFGEKKSSQRPAPQRLGRSTSEPSAPTGSRRRESSAEKRPAGKSFSEKPPSEKPPFEKGATAQPTAEKPEPASPHLPVPPPPQPPVEPVVVRGEPMADDFGADLAAGSALVASGRGGRSLAGPLGGRLAPTRRKLQKSSEWDSMLLLVGGASLGVLLIVGGFLYFSLTRGAAEEMFDAAEAAYRDEAYVQATKLYDDYLEDYPRHDKAGLARVKREVARLRQVFKTPEQGLTVAAEILPLIENEEEFPRVRDELASMLPRIARGFVDQAMLADDSAKKQALLVQTARAMELVDNPVYIPSSLRKSQQTTIAGIEEDVARAQREIDRDAELLATVNAINDSVATGETQLAYQAREMLLSKYPGLDSNEILHEAVLRISQKERERVRVSDEPLTAMTDDPSTTVAAATVLCQRTGQAVGGVANYVVYVLAGGSVFALDAATGDVLWRRFVGYETTTAPQPLSYAAPLSDALVVDHRTSEVMRLEAKSGTLLWRLPIGEPFADPVLMDDHAFIATRSGKLLIVDIATGNVARQVVIPQPLETSPGVTDRRPCFYQLGDQDNLYVISRETLECQEVFYIGHKRGTIAVPPVMVLGYLFVVENTGPDYCRLHIIATDQDGLNLKHAQPTQRLQGQVLVTPVVGRRRVLVVTDLRAMELYDVDPNNADTTPVTLGGRNNATAEAPLTSYPLLTSGYMWVANNRFTKYQVQASTGKLPTEWVIDEQDVYVAPLQLIQDVIIHVRRRQGAAGFTVAATRVNDKDPSWQTEIAVPPRCVMVKGETIESVSARGRLFEIDPTSAGQRVVNAAKQSATRDEKQVLALTDAIDLGNGQSVLSPRSGYNQLVFYQQEGENAGLRLLTLTIPLGDASLEPTPFGGGLLVPLRDGRAVLVDPVTGANRVDPFHPEIEAGTDTQWNDASVLDGGLELVIANDRQRLYRVGINEKPQPHLQELAMLAMAQPLSGPLATIESICYGVDRGAATDTLLSFALPELKPAHQSPLEGRVAWGPRRVGKLVLLCTDTEFICLDGAPQLRWKTAWKYGPIVGRPVVVDSHLVLATDDGMLLRVDAATGETLGAISVGEPLTWGPIAYQDRWLVASKCGALFLVAEGNL